MDTGTKKNEVLANSLNDLMSGLGFSQDNKSQLSQVATLIKNNRNYFVSNDRATLTYAYTTHGIVQTLIDQPVEDAFRGGIEIISNQLDAKEIKQLQNFISENDINLKIKELAKWDRLFGGGAMVINTIGKSNKPININAINKNTPLSFYAADLWELGQSNNEPYSENKPYVKTGIHDKQFNFYGNVLHESRLLIVKGKKSPSFVRGQLRGWGMSEVERLIRSVNQYLKNNDLIFELLDEAKIDVYGIMDFNNGLLSKGGTKKIENRIKAANMIKNYQNAIVKDKEDEYEQKQINFSGLSDMLQQIRIGIASDLKMPLTKLFGISSTGFNSGEDDIENYNSMIESEIRGKFDNVIIQMLKIICQKLFEFVPEDINIKYKPLRILGAEQEENVRTSKIQNILSLYDRRLINSEQVIEEINQNNIFSTDLENENIVDFPAPLIKEEIIEKTY